MEADHEWRHRGYGKNHVKLLHVRREGPVHSIKEYEVSSQLTLVTDKDYTTGDNSDIVATDSQKNTVYILAKKHGVTSPEEFALILCSHFLTKYAHVKHVEVGVEEHPWRRMVVDGRAHNHAFLSSPECIHTCLVRQHRGEEPVVTSGLEGLRVIKTTQSAFINFVSDEFRSLPDMKDRIFSTIVTASWCYSHSQGVDFAKAWLTVKKILLDKFAGPADTGIYSPSVQNTLFLAQQQALQELPEVGEIKICMPNKHYFGVDLSKFPEVGASENNEVFMPVDKPAGNITATLGRKIKAKL